MLSTSAERDILSVISEYHQNIVPLIDSYVQSAVTSKRVFLSTPAYKIRRVISDEIKNAADHLGRASVADTDARAFEQTAMARWHMDQVKNIGAYLAE